MSDDDNRRGRGGPRKPGGGKGFGGKGFGGKSAGGKSFGGKSFGARSFGDRPRDDRPRDDRPRDDRPRGDAGGDRPFRKPHFDKPRFERGEGGGDRPFRAREDGRPPRRFEGEGRPPRRFDDDRPPRRFQDRGDRPEGGDRPERKRPAPRPFLPRTGNPERLLQVEKEGGVERIAKVIARAGAASRREAEEMIEQGRVAVNGETITSPALDVAPDARITIDGERLPARERTRLFLYHKPAGLVTTTYDPEGRPTVFAALPEDLPRVVTIGRLDINTEGLLLLTNDGGLARVLGHPETAWLRRYRARAYGHVDQAKLDELAKGISIDGEAFGPIIATMDREQGDNTWLTIDLREGRNREVKRVLEHVGLTVNRLIRVSFGPFQLGDLPEGEVEEVRTKVLRDQLGEQLSAIAGADFDAPIRAENRVDRPRRDDDGERPMRGRFGDDRPPRGRFGDDKPPRGRFGDDKPPRGRSGDRGPRRDDGGAPAKRGRPSPYRRAAEEDADAPREILRRAEEGRPAVWRDEETSGMKPRRTGPRRGADPREERERRAQSLAAQGRERERAEPVADPKGRRVKVERITGASPDLPRKPRYTRDDFKARDGEGPTRARPPREDGDRPRRPRFERDGGDAPRGERRFGDRPERSFGDKPRGRSVGGRSFGDRSFGDRDGGGRSFGDRPPRAGGDKPFRRREDGEGRSFGDRPRGDKPFGKKPFGAGGRSGGGGFGGRPPRGDGPSRGEGPSRGDGPSRGGPRGPRKPRD